MKATTSIKMQNFQPVGMKMDENKQLPENPLKIYICL
jgi:cell fate regulator YaaT (PSP1 superfamily)